MRRYSSVLHYLGTVLVAFSLLQAAPLLISAIYRETVRFPMRIYVIPAGISLFVGLSLVLLFRPRRLTLGTAMAVGALGWFGLSLVGAIPYWLALDLTYLDAFFETTSGFTTTGATLFTGLSLLPKSILLWRGLTEWIGGLGIFTLFLFVMREGGGRHVLISAEAHKAASERFSPGLFSSLRILWSIYAGLTLGCALLLFVEGMSPFDAAIHALTTVSTGGFSNYDRSIGYFAAAGYPHAASIEYTIIAFMFLGGTSFLIHWHLLRRRLGEIRANTEFWGWIGILLAAAAIVAIADRGRIAEVGASEYIRSSLFHVVSIATTTGFTLRPIDSSWFTPLAKQALFILMIVGGCVGSTAGGMKVLRVVLLGKLLRRRLRVITGSPHEVAPITLNRRLVSPVEVERAAAVAVGWAGAIVVVWLAASAVSGLGGWESLSAATSALGNVGPNYVPSQVFLSIGPGAKVIYILAMVAGRLEILPLLLIFSRRVWR